LLLTQRELLVDVGLQGVIGRVNLVLLLLVLLVIVADVLPHLFLKQIGLFLIDFKQLGVECFDRLLQTLMVLLQLFRGVFNFDSLFLSAFDEHVDVLHDVVFGGLCLNAHGLLTRYQIDLVDLLLELFYLSLESLVLPLDFYQLHFGLTGLTLYDSLRRVDRQVFLIRVCHQHPLVETFMLHAILAFLHLFKRIFV